MIKKNKVKFEIKKRPKLDNVKNLKNVNILFMPT